ncbi:O-succinylhomoserine sulfhydrylase [Zavarzinia sp. CC-PAN008]|uniref:O-succinylhomoserine sulfhydrylase n=1 Tax=Zavarzinia sp. CC-PAN008 TaxID=3243332 RepID=UPI003F7457CB
MARIVTKDMARNWRTATRLVRGGTRRSDLGETSEAIYMTSGFRYDDAETAEARFKGQAEGFTYSRLANPTASVFEDRMALLEGADTARATASGMAAVAAALLCQVRAGERVVAGRALFGSCRYILEEVLPRFGVTVELVDPTDPAAWERALSQPTRCVFLESPANPTLEVVDLKRVADLAHAVGAVVVVDNVFATPLLQHPLELGCDVVVYSATKHIDGQGRCLGGCILAGQDFHDQHLNQYLRHTGPSMSPFNAWVLAKGLETLELRVTRHCENAAKVADFLAETKAAGRVRYPGRPDHPQYDLVQKQMGGVGGSVVTFELPGGQARAFEVMNRLQLIDISNNLGDAKSLITHPASTTHQRLTPEQKVELGIGAGMVRLSVGLEDAQDIIEDLEQALR